MSTFQLTLKGYQSDREDTEHLVKWINAPGRSSLNLWIERAGLQPYKDGLISRLLLPGNEEKTWEDGLDAIVQERSAEGLQPQHLGDHVYWVAFSRPENDVEAWMRESKEAQANLPPPPPPSQVYVDLLAVFAKHGVTLSSDDEERLKDFVLGVE